MPVVVHLYPLQAVLAHRMGIFWNLFFCGETLSNQVHPFKEISTIKEKGEATSPITWKPTSTSRLPSMFFGNSNLHVVLSSVANIGKERDFNISIRIQVHQSLFALQESHWDSIISQTTGLIHSDRESDLPSATTHMVKFILCNIFFLI